MSLALLAGVVGSLNAEDQAPPAPDQLPLLKQRIDALEQQIKDLQGNGRNPATPPAASAPATPASASAAAAEALEARIWKLEAEARTDDGFSIGGDGDITLVRQKGMGYTASADFNPILLYSYKDAFLFGAEINASQDSVALGQAWAAYTALSHMVVEAGLFPIPFGTYSERYSPTWINKFSNLAPAPYNEDYGVFSGDQTIDGAQLRGDVPLADSLKLTYHVFIAAPPTYNGPDNAAADDRLSFGGVNATHVPPTIGGRIGVLLMTDGEVGLSAMTGHIINNQTIDPTIDDGQRRSFAALAIDGEYRIQHIVLRGEYVRLNYQDPSGARQHSQGGYAEASRRLSEVAGWVGGFEPTLRFGRMQRSSSDNGFQDISEMGVGINYYFTAFIRTSLMAIAATAHDEDQVALNSTVTF
jgi:hypothetical protein